MHEVNKIPLDSVSSLQDRRPSATARLTPLNSSNQHSARPLSSHLDYGYPLASPSARSAHRSSAMLSPSSPPDSRRPLSPAAPSEDDFRSLCQAFYYAQDERAGKLMDQTLKQVPAASRKTYITIQALVRAQFHRDEEGKRRETLCTLLRNCESGSVMRRELGLGAASGPQAWRSKSARHARSRRLLAFLRSHSLKSHPGPHPFLRSLYALLSIQTDASTDGFLMEVDIDDSLFLENGRDFMEESIQLLKGVLGLEETVKAAAPSLSRSTSLASTMSETSELSQSRRPTAPAPPTRPPIHPRDRSGSDPFMDCKSYLLANGSPSTPDTSTLPSTPFAQVAPSPKLGSSTNKIPPLMIRTFTMPPYLTDPELKALRAMFPRWITQPAIDSLPLARATPRTLEEGRGVREMKVVNGHGVVRLSERPRDSGFKGSLWERITSWFGSLFG